MKLNKGKIKAHLKELLLILSLLAAAGAISVVVFKIYKNDLFHNKESRSLKELGDFKLNMNFSDLKFYKGIPDSHFNGDILVYGDYFLVLGDTSINSIIYFGGKKNCPSIKNRDLFGPSIQHPNDDVCFLGYSLQSLIDFLGEPSEHYEINNGYQRIYNFRAYNLIFIMEKGIVIGFGVSDYHSNLNMIVPPNV